MPKIMKIIDERETQKTNKQASKNTNEQGETEAIVKVWELNGFLCI